MVGIRGLECQVMGTKVRKTESGRVGKSQDWADPLEWEVLSFKLSTQMGLALGGRLHELDVRVARLDCIFMKVPYLQQIERSNKTSINNSILHS